MAAIRWTFNPLQTTFDRNNPEDLQNIPDTLVVTLSGNDISDYENFRDPANGCHPRAARWRLLWAGLGYQTQDATQPLTAVLTANVLGNTFAGNGILGRRHGGRVSLQDRPASIAHHVCGQLRGEFIRRTRAPGGTLQLLLNGVPIPRWCS